MMACTGNVPVLFPSYMTIYGFSVDSVLHVIPRIKMAKNRWRNIWTCIFVRTKRPALTQVAAILGVGLLGLKYVFSILFLTSSSNEISRTGPETLQMILKAKGEWKTVPPQWQLLRKQSSVHPTLSSPRVMKPNLSNVRFAKNF